MGPAHGPLGERSVCVADAIGGARSNDSGFAKHGVGTRMTARHTADAASHFDPRTTIVELVNRSCLALDDKDFDGYLALCGEGFHYTITAYSPEIRKQMTWLSHDKRELATLFANLPKHNSDACPPTRHVTVYTVAFSAAATRPKSSARCRSFAPGSMAARRSCSRSAGCSTPSAQGRAAPVLA
jgi:hypothetical protein